MKGMQFASPLAENGCQELPRFSRGSGSEAFLQGARTGFDDTTWAIGHMVVLCDAFCHRDLLGHAEHPSRYIHLYRQQRRHAFHQYADFEQLQSIHARNAIPSKNQPQQRQL
jgi:hypothetical protein